MTWVYVAAMMILGYLIGLLIGSVKQNSEKYFIEDFLIGFGIVNITFIIYLITQT